MTDPRALGDPAPAVDALRRGLDRFGVDRLVGSPDLCRNVLRDYLPDDPRTVTLLVAAAAEGVPRRLLQRSEGDDRALLVLRLAEATGLREDFALQAVDIWATALGVPSAGAPPRDPASSWSAPTTMPMTDRPTVVLSRPSAAATVELAARPARRRGAVVAVVAGAAGVLVLVVVVVAATVLGARPPVLARAVGSAAGAIERSGDAAVLTSGGAAIAPGQTVSATIGPVELQVNGAGVVRAASGARVTYTAAAKDSDPAAFRVVTGSVWVNTGSSGRIRIATGSASVTVAAGRLAISCGSSGCTAQALEERQAVATRGGAISLLRHQRIELPSSGSTTPKALYTAPDVLRADTWITGNVRRDRTDSLAGDPISGPRLVGPWAFAYDAPYIANDVHHPVTLSTSCSAGGSGCRLTARSVQSSCTDGSSSCEITGTVTVRDQSGRSVAIDYPSFPVDCSGDGKKDGTESLEDVFTVRGSAVRGTRAVQYDRASDSPCTDDERDLTKAVPFTGKAGPLAADVFPQPGPEEQLLLRHQNNLGPCTRATLRTGAIASAECTFDGPEDANGRMRPDRVRLDLFSGTTEQATAYRSAAKPAGKAGSGTCGETACESPFSDRAGRIAMWTASGTPNLVAYQPGDSTVLLAASGAGSFKSLITWYQKTDDFALFIRWSLGV